MGKILLLCASDQAKDVSLNAKIISNASQYLTDKNIANEKLYLSDLNLELYSQAKNKESIPADAELLFNKFVESESIFIASPEHNGSYTTILKNAIDWISVIRKSVSPFINKKVAIASASPGALGGIRGLVSLRLLLANLNMNVVGHQTCIGNAFTKFDENNNLQEGFEKELLIKTINSLL